MKQKISLLVACCWALPLWAQDPLPAEPNVQSPSAVTTIPGAVAEPVSVPGACDTIPLLSLVLPAAFRGTASNDILDESGELAPFFDKLCRAASSDTVVAIRVVHIGDSHVRGHIFPQTAGGLLSERFVGLVYTDHGINGATTQSYARSQVMAGVSRLRPDLLIISFGTNESHDTQYNAARHWDRLTEFVSMLRRQMPGVPLLLTTPPGSYERRGRRRRASYTVNPRTAVAARNMVRFGRENHVAVWDIYSIAGGAQNWQRAHLMRPDHVHYQPAGYELQGRLLYQAIIKAYNRYVATR